MLHFILQRAWLGRDVRLYAIVVANDTASAPASPNLIKPALAPLAPHACVNSFMQFGLGISILQLLQIRDLRIFMLLPELRKAGRYN